VEVNAHVGLLRFNIPRRLILAKPFPEVTRVSAHRELRILAKWHRDQAQTVAVLLLEFQVSCVIFVTGNLALVFWFSIWHLYLLCSTADWQFLTGRFRWHTIEKDGGIW
jgi:hypothetical protein